MLLSVAFTLILYALLGKGVHGQCSTPPKNLAVYEGTRDILITCNRLGNTDWQVISTSDELHYVTITISGKTVHTSLKTIYRANHTGLIIKKATTPGRIRIATAGLYFAETFTNVRRGAKLLVVHEGPTCTCNAVNSTSLQMYCSVKYADSRFHPIKAIMTWTSSRNFYKRDTPQRSRVNRMFVSTSTIIVDANVPANYQCTLTFTKPTSTQFRYVATNAPKFIASCKSPFCHRATTTSPIPMAKPPKTSSPTSKTEPITTSSPTSTTEPPTTSFPTSTTEPPTTSSPTSTTELPTTSSPTSTIEPPATSLPTSTTEPPTTSSPASTTEPPTTSSPTSKTDPPTTSSPTSTTEPPTTSSPTSTAEPPATSSPTSTTEPPTTSSPTSSTEPPTTSSPTSTIEPPTTSLPTSTTEPPITISPASTTEPLTTSSPTSTTEPPTTKSPTSTTEPPTSTSPTSTTEPPTTSSPTSTIESPTTSLPTSTTEPPTTSLPTSTTEPPTTSLPTSTTEPPTTSFPTSTTESPTTSSPESTTEPTTTSFPTSTTGPPTTSSPTSTTEPPTTSSSTSMTEPPTTSSPASTTEPPTTSLRTSTSEPVTTTLSSAKIALPSTTECRCPSCPTCPPSDQNCAKASEYWSEGVNLNEIYEECVAKAELYAKSDSCCQDALLCGVVVTLRNESRWLIHDRLCDDGICEMAAVNASYMSNDWKLLDEKKIIVSGVGDFIEAGNIANANISDCSESCKRMMQLA